jgi:hypothetical protein
VRPSPLGKATTLLSAFHNPPPKLAFANIESLARLKRIVNDLGKLHIFHVDATLLAEQEAYYIYCDRYTTWLNYEVRFRAGHLAKNMIPKPRRIKRPRLKLK